MVSARSKWERLGTGWGITLLRTEEWPPYPEVFAARIASITAYGDTAKKACNKLSMMYFLHRRAMLRSTSSRRALWEFPRRGPVAH